MLYMQHYIGIVHFLIKIYWLFGTVRRTTKLIEGGHRGLQAPYMLLLLRFFTLFQNPKSRDFLRFFAVSRTFSRTMLLTTLCGGLACQSVTPFGNKLWSLTYGPDATIIPGPPRALY